MVIGRYGQYDENTVLLQLFNDNQESLKWLRIHKMFEDSCVKHYSRWFYVSI